MSAGPDVSDVPDELREPARAALRAAGVGDGHMAIALVGAAEIRELNRRHRGIDSPTDVLAFPVDGPGPAAGPRELGDVVICPEHCADVVEAAVHGTLHLCGFDHESDAGEMVGLQEAIMNQLHQAAPGVGASAREGDGLTGASGNEEAASVSTRAGFVGLAGRPNVGKSTLVNAVVGSRVAIVSPRPQTTRRAIRGVATDTGAGTQLILIDLPGVQRPRDVLTQRMQHRVERELADSDVALLVVNGEEGVGPGDRFIAQALLAANEDVPVICAVNKIDTVRRAGAAAALTDAAALEGVNEVFPVSARKGTGMDALAGRLTELLPEGPFLYSPEDRTDQPGETMLAELIREQVLNRTRDEIPHSVEVAVLDVEPRDDGLVTIRAEIWADSESQKGILIGRRGAKVREIGTAARRQLELELGAPVHLDLQVRVRRRWRRDESLLDRLGIE